MLEVVKLFDIEDLGDEVVYGVDDNIVDDAVIEVTTNKSIHPQDSFYLDLWYIGTEGPLILGCLLLLFT